LIGEITILLTDLHITSGEAGIKKNKQILSILIVIQDLIEKFLKQNRNSLKIILN